VVFGPDNPVDLADDPDVPLTQGPLERAVRADLEALALVSPTARSMEELAFNLARKLDDGAGMATAAVAQQLRETLAQMAEEAGDDDGSALLERLSTPMPPAVGNTPPA
jgi:hypothetical protein